MTLRWVAADFVSREIVADLATFVPDLPLRHTLSDQDTGTAKLYLDGAPPDWRQLIIAGETVVAAYDDADPSEGIVWAGFVYIVDPDTSSDALTLSLSTIEGYLARRYVGDVTYTAGTKRDAVIADMVANFVAAGISGIPGVPITVTIVGDGGPALPDDRVYQNADNATVAQRNADLIAEFGGEYTIRVGWDGDGQHLAYNMLVGDRLGAASPTGVPAVTFDRPGPITSVSRLTDYSDGVGANVITPYSSGEGSVTPYGAPVIVNDGSRRPVFEYRYQPVASETDTAVLDRHAQQAAGVLGPGAQALTLTLALDQLGVGQRLGSDWDVGDDVGYRIEPCLPFPDGLDGTARVIAVDLGTDSQDGQPSTITPIFAQPEVYTEVSNS